MNEPQEWTSKFRLTVPQDFYDATCEAVGQPFADSYLFGAILRNNRLMPRTLTGYLKMRDRRAFLDLLKNLEISLDKPAPWPGDGTRASSGQCFG